VQKRLGKTLKEVIRESKRGRLSLKSAVQVGLQLIDRLKHLHDTGHIHLDIKPDNIMLASRDFASQESSVICLIDFGISKEWRNEDGSHIEMKKIKRFCGNLLFAS
jgi:serine/threonine protein kinase